MAKILKLQKLAILTGMSGLSIVHYCFLFIREKWALSGLPGPKPQSHPPEPNIWQEQVIFLLVQLGSAIV